MIPKWLVWTVSSPTSASNLMGREHQRGANSGSSEDQSDDEIEAGSCEQSNDPLTLKKIRRCFYFTLLALFFIWSSNLGLPFVEWSLIGTRLDGRDDENKLIWLNSRVRYVDNIFVCGCIFNKKFELGLVRSNLVLTVRLTMICNGSKRTIFVSGSFRLAVTNGISHWAVC